LIRKGDRAMNEQQMKSFISVAKHRSISKAAEELNISQQGLSRIIGVIEGELGVKLFARASGGVALTDLGSMILPVATSMLKSHEEYMNIINGIIEKHRETITITYEHALLSVDIPFDVAARFERINFNILIAGNIDACMTQVLNGTADLGFCHSNSNFGKLEYIPVIHEPITVFMCRDHPLAVKKELVISDLQGVCQFFPSISLPKIAINYLEICVKEGFYPDYELKSNDPNILIGAIRDKTGVLVGSRHTFSGLPDDIIGIPLMHELITMDMGFLVKPPVKRSVLSFIDVVQKHYNPGAA
jgi:DNA-binding transcriptional LysR family regulator